MIQFHETMLGQRFFEGTLPKLIRELERLNENLADQNLLKQRELEKEKDEVAMTEEKPVNIDTRKRSLSSIKFDGISYDADYIIDHIQEFKDTLEDGSGTYDFEMQSNVSDALGHYAVWYYKDF